MPHILLPITYICIKLVYPLLAISMDKGTIKYKKSPDITVKKNEVIFIINEYLNIMSLH